jgi:L-ascorbate metabolism protein UlaG (beta-lactamase superfamily)
MKVAFVGLSSFLLENNSGGRILLDPYKDSPEHYLGLSFPATLQADLFLVSHPDDDHSNLTAKMLRKRNISDKNDEDELLFPNINIRGTLVKEFNGDLNIAYSFTLDDMRILHLADNAHELNRAQISEIGQVDVVFMSPPKVVGQNFHTANIQKLKPKAVFISHYLPPEQTDENPDRISMQKFIGAKFQQDWIINPHANEKTAETITNMFFEGLKLKDKFEFEQIFSDFIEIEKPNLPQQTKVYLFRKCLGS